MAFECDICLRSFDTRQKLGVHRSSHEMATCEACGRSMPAPGIGKHRKSCAAEQAFRRLTARLVKLIASDTAPETAERAAQLVGAAEEREGAFVVVGASFGPFLTSRLNVGGLVAHAGEACLVVDLDLMDDSRMARLSALEGR